MAVRRLTVQTGPRGAPGSGRCALSLVAWHSMGGYDGAWRRSLRCNGRQSRSPGGWSSSFRQTETRGYFPQGAIYRSLFVKTRGVLKKGLTQQWRKRRKMRHAKGGKAKNGQGHILDMVSIRERPAEAEDRAVPGHWEGDLLTGASDTHIVTLV